MDGHPSRGVFGKQPPSLERLKMSCSVCSKPPPKEEAPFVCSGCKISIYCSVECQNTAWPGHRMACREVHLPHLLVLLSEMPHVPLHPQVWETAVSLHATLTTTNSTESALATLAAGATHSPEGVLVCGDSLFHADPVAFALRTALVAYIERGGRAVLCGGSIHSYRFDVLREFLDSMGVNWQLGTALRTNLEYNTAFATSSTSELMAPLSPKTIAHLTRPMSRPPSPLIPGGEFGLKISSPSGGTAYVTRGVNLLGVPEDEAVYVSTTGATASLSPKGDGIPKYSTTVAMKRVGMGWLGFVGDMEMVDETVAIVLGMLGCDVVAARFPS